MKIGLVIMASGLGKRFGGNKLMTTFIDKPLIKWILDATEGLFDERIVVTRDEKIVALCQELEISCIHHDLPNRNDTVRLGLTALRESIDYCFFVPGDQPLLKRETLSKLVEQARQNGQHIIRTKYQTFVGAPIGFPKDKFEELLSLPEGKGGNWVASKYAEEMELVCVENEWELADIDTREDMEKIKLQV